MSRLIPKLSDTLIADIRSADEIWIAVALLNTSGLKILTDYLPKDCIQHYLVGVDLPTEPKALWTLFQLHFKIDLTVAVYTGKEYFHPKMYLLRTGASYKAFVGSANCTLGGLSNNVELTLSIDEPNTCKEVKAWFERLYLHSKPLQKPFLERYQKTYAAKQERKKEEERLAKEEKLALNKEYEVTLREKNDFIRVLKRYRQQTSEYPNIVAKRKADIERLRATLDYPNFSDTDLDGFFGIWELGHILSLPKPTINREIKKFARLLRMLFDEGTDITIRYDAALDNEAYKIRGINEGLISKLLTIHNPKLYYVKNSKTDAALKKYGISFPRGLSKGNRYKAACNFLKVICQDTDIENLAVLDNYLYIEGNEV